MASGGRSASRPISTGTNAEENQQILTEEVDYQWEASSSTDGPTPQRSDYTYMLAKDPSRVAIWREENGVDPARVGRRLIFSLLRRPSRIPSTTRSPPGNIMLLRGTLVALIDLG